MRDHGPMGPLLSIGHMKKTFGSLVALKGGFRVLYVQESE